MTAAMSLSAMTRVSSRRRRMTARWPSCCAEHPDAILVCRRHRCRPVDHQAVARPSAKSSYLGRVRGLRRIADDGDACRLGAAVTYAEAEALPRPPSIPISASCLRRLGSKQVRASGTVGGNIANGSPIGDMPPALIALGAPLELRQGGSVTRHMPLEDFFIAYGKQDRAARRDRLAASSFRSSSRMKPSAATRSPSASIRIFPRCWAPSNSRSMAAQIASARIAFGGMAATPKRAAEDGSGASSGFDSMTAADMASGRSSAGRGLSSRSMTIAASADYRMKRRAALLLKALTEIAGEIDGQHAHRRASRGGGLMRV